MDHNQLISSEASLSEFTLFSKRVNLGVNRKDKTAAAAFQPLPIYAKCPFCRTSANSAKPDQAAQYAVSDLVLYCLLTEVSF